MDHFKDIEDALCLIRTRKVALSGGPTQPWFFLMRVAQHLERQLTEAYEPIWKELREDSHATR